MYGLDIEKPDPKQAIKNQPEDEIVPKHNVFRVPPHEFCMQHIVHTFDTFYILFYQVPNGQTISGSQQSWDFYPYKLKRHIPEK